MSLKSLKGAARRLTPPWALELYQKRSAIGQARSLAARCERLGLEDIIEEVGSCRLLRSMQKRAEILQLLQIVRDLRPKRVCEIGSAGGGTLALFCQVADPEARILSLDIGYDVIQQAAYPHLVRAEQRMTCLALDTHVAATREAVDRWLGGQRFDVLFIDGDHSLAGVTLDFEMYAPFVRPGGLIAFHDIVPDHKMRYGQATASDVGEVPTFWAELKAQYASARDLVEDPLQDGFGIGVLQWNGAKVPVAGGGVPRESRTVSQAHAVESVVAEHLGSRRP